MTPLTSTAKGGPPGCGLNRRTGPGADMQGRGAHSLPVSEHPALMSFGTQRVVLLLKSERDQT